MDKLYESSDVFLSKPAGIELVKLRDKYFTFVALEDGSLIRQEVKTKPKSSGYSSLAFGPKQTIEGNGNGIVKMYSNDEYLIIEHTGGLASLWSTKGSEICQYSKKSTATLFTSEPIMGKDDKIQKLLHRLTWKYSVLLSQNAWTSSVVIRERLSHFWQLETTP